MILCPHQVKRNVPIEPFLLLHHRRRCDTRSWVPIIRLLSTTPPHLRLDRHRTRYHISRETLCYQSQFLPSPLSSDHHGFFIVTTPRRACSLTLPCSMERRVSVV
jgi:hypothetical protein